MSESVTEKVKLLGTLLANALPDDHKFILIVFEPNTEKDAFFLSNADPKDAVTEVKQFLVYVSETPKSEVIQ